MLMVKEKIRHFKEQADSKIIRYCLNGRFFADNAIILTSSPRSGSTLLGQILSAIPQSCILFEPLHIGEVPEAAKAGFDWRTYVNPDTEWLEGAAFLKKIFEGRVVNDWISHEITARQAFNSKQLIVKFVRANRLLPWLCKAFDIPAPVFLMRHPCAVIASQVKYGWHNAQYAPESPAYFNEYPAFQDVLKRLDCDVEYLAALWALDQLPALMQPTPLPWTLITYEELVLHPQVTIQKLFQRWNIDLDMDLALKKLQVPSSVVNRAGISGISGWKKQLTDEQVSRILKTIHAFGLTFYGYHEEADYDCLYSPQLCTDIKSLGKAS